MSGKWIRVSDRLPEDRRRVLVYAGEMGTVIRAHQNERLLVFLASFRRGRGPDPESPWSWYDQWGNNSRVPYAWDTGHSKLYGHEVTHWMDAPEPPTEEPSNG